MPITSFNLFRSKANSAKLDVSLGRISHNKWFSSDNKRQVATMDLPIGYDNFGKVIENKLTFVDKSLFIKDFIDDKSTEVALIYSTTAFW